MALAGRLTQMRTLAVAVGGVRGHPNGFEFTVHVRLRQQGFVWGTGPFDSLADPRTARAPEQALQLGILYVNGRRARPPATGRPWGWPASRLLPPGDAMSAEVRKRRAGSGCRCCLGPSCRVARRRGCVVLASQCSVRVPVGRVPVR